MDWSYLTIGNVISCTDATEDRVDESDVNRNGRHMATSLRHDCKKRVLSQKCTNFVCREIFFLKNAIGPFSQRCPPFSAHIWSSYKCSGSRRSERAIVGDKWRRANFSQSRFDCRMSASFNFESPIAVNNWRFCFVKQTNKQVRRFAPKLYNRFAFFLPGRT